MSKFLAAYIPLSYVGMFSVLQMRLLEAVNLHPPDQEGRAFVLLFAPLFLPVMLGMAVAKSLFAALMGITP